MREALADAELGDAGMVAVAGDAILAEQLLVKSNLRLAGEDGFALGGADADVGHLVAYGAFFRRRAEQKVVAGQAIRFAGAMAVDQLAWADQQVRKGEGQSRERQQVEQKNDFDGPAHFHSQNRKMLTI